MTNPKIVVEGAADFHRLNSDLSRTTGMLGKLGHAAKVGAAVGFGLAGAAAVKFAVDSTKSLARIERINSQTSAAIKSTGGAAGVSAKHVEALSGRLENLTATEAESIQQGANFLLTFTNIRNAAGKNNKIYDQAVVAMTDMSRAMDQTGGAVLDTRSQALQLGKALNDPIKGITALQRVGVAFTEEQKKTITTLVESGETMKAQKIILAELTKEFGGSGEAFARTTTGKIELAKHALGTFGETIMADLLPAISTLADKGTAGLEFLTDHADDVKAGFVDMYEAVKPALDETREALGHLVDSASDGGDVFHDKFLPVLSETADALAAVIDFVDDLPGPVKNLGAEAGIAAILFFKLASGVDSAKLKLAGMVGPTATATTRLAALQKAASGAGGIAGMLLLSKGLQHADTQAGVLENSLGGLLTGAAFGGLPGAVIGAFAGMVPSFVALRHQTSLTEERAADGAATWQDYAGSLNDVSAAMDEQTRKMAYQSLQSQGLLSSGKQLGLTQRQVLDGILGEGKARRTLTQALAQEQRAILRTGTSVKLTQEEYDNLSQAEKDELAATSDNLEARQKVIDRLRAEIGVIRQSVREKINEIAVVKKIPRRVVTDFLQNGIVKGIDDVRELAEKYRLTPKQVRTIVKATNVDVTKKDLLGLLDDLKDVDRQRPNPRLGADEREASTKVARIMADLRELDRQYVKPKSTLTLDEYYRKRNELLTSLHNIPDEYVNIWVARREGGGGGGGGNENLVPSKSLVPDVEDPFGLAKGVETGLAKMQQTTTVVARKTGHSIVGGLIHGLTGGADDVRAALDKLTAYLRKRIDLKDAKAERAREKAVLAHLANEYAALVKVGKAQDALNRKLEKARQHLSEVRSYVEQIRQSFVDTGNVVNLGQLEDGTQSAPLMIDQLRDKVAQAQRFAQLIRDLTDANGPRINQTTLQQLLQAGPEAGLATAEALSAGGSAAIDEINQLTQQLAQTGQQLGSEMSDQFYDVGLNAALGIVEGLESESRRLDRAARRLAHRLAAEVRKALGIHSPSREFQGIGEQTIRGLTLGLDDTYVRAQGRKVAASLVDGFSTPQLGASVGVGGGGTAAVSVKLTADQASQLQRGKSVTLDIDAGRARGVRRKAVAGVGG